MKLTTKYKLPEAFALAVANDDYSKGDSDYSATELLSPPRQLALREKHWEELEEDVSDRVWSLFGQGVHYALERSNLNDLAETRFFSRFGDFTVSAQIDCFSERTGVLTDYKTASVYGARPNSPIKPEWVQQLNIQAELLRRHDFNVERAEIVAILKDFSINKAKTEDNYPSCPVVAVHVPLWERDAVVGFINERITLIEAAKKGALPQCTDEEVWAKETKWAVMKKGQKRAMKLCETEKGALALSALNKGTYVEKRPGKRTRCESYCLVVNKCTQYQDFKKRGNK